MTPVADPLRRSRGQRVSPAAIALRTLAPAAYGAALLGGLFSPSHVGSPSALSLLGAFIAYFLWRIYQLAVGSQGAELERVEIGVLALLALSTVVEAIAPPLAWAQTAYAMLLVGLAAVIPLSAVLVLPLLAVPLWRSAPAAIAHLVLLAGVAGTALALAKWRHLRLQRAYDKVRLDQEHLDGQTGANSPRKQELSRLDDLLYNYLQEVKEHAQAHGAVLVMVSPKGQLFVRELVSDSPNLREDRVFNLTSTTFQWILENRKPLSVGSLGDPAARLGYYSGRVAVKSFLGVPVVASGEVHGVLALDHLKENAFDDAHLTMLKVAAHQVATILTQIHDLERWKRKSRAFEHLYEFFKGLVGCGSVPEVLDLLLGTVQTRLQPEFAALALVGEGGRLRFEAVSGAPWAYLKGREFDPGDGLCGWVLQTGPYLHYQQPREGSRRPLFSSEIKEPKLGSLILQSVRDAGRPVGLLCVGSSALNAFDQSSVQFCDFLAQAGAQGVSLLRARVELERLATTDALTGLSNRRVFFERLQGEVTRSRRYEQPLSLLLLDVDHFKKINDVHGHPAGDEALRAIAGSVGAFARETDLAARYGGEEFAVLLPSTTEAGARILAERVRTGIAALTVEWEKKPIPLRVSIGVATLEPEPDHGERLVARADQALYAAKQTGRDKVVMYSQIREYASWK